MVIWNFTLKPTAQVTKVKRIMFMVAWISRTTGLSRSTSGFGVSTFIALRSKSDMVCLSRRLPHLLLSSRVILILYQCRFTTQFPLQSRLDVFLTSFSRRQHWTPSNIGNAMVISEIVTWLSGVTCSTPRRFLVVRSPVGIPWAGSLDSFAASSSWYF